MDFEESNLCSDLRHLTKLDWRLEETGGGCTALVLELLAGSDWGHYFMVTHSEDASVPQKNEPHHLGEYVGVNDLNHWRFENRDQLVKFLRTWFKNRDTE